MEKKKKKRSVLSTIVLIIALGVFCYSAFQLFLILSEYQKGDNEYKEILEEAVVEEVADEKEGEAETAKEEIVFRVDFDKLLSMNPDTVAWIRFEEPKKISYPVVQGTDNSVYLKKTFEGKKNAAGAIFMDAVNKGDFTDRNTFIYGHNMKNGSMFGQLRKYKSADFCKEHPFFYVYTPDGREIKYQVFAVGIVEDTAESYRCTYADDTEFLKYLNHLRSISPYKSDLEPEADWTIVSLSTCTNVTETQRLLVHGVKISEKVAGE